MGAMSPVSIPATLAQQIAEALAGISLAQITRPGCPVILGSFLSNIDMQSGSPQFGTPESAIGLLCTGQLARRFGLPWRSGGGLTSSQTADAQAAYEAMMTMLPTFLAGTNWVMHSRRLAGERPRLVLREVRDRHRDPAHAAGRVHAARDPRGGRWPGTPTPRSATAATSSAARTPWSASAPASTGRCCRSSENFDRWKKNGGQDAADRAGEIAHQRLEAYEAPPMDDAIRAELEEFVIRRRRELGD